jgi:hypothetical protein
MLHGEFEEQNIRLDVDGFGSTLTSQHVSSIAYKTPTRPTQLAH